jgi:asparagine synthase (glutamine-hydrolysing)
MCGINGIYNIANTNVPELTGLIKGMNKTIAHRGPDDDGVYHSGNNQVAFGHQRLSILDLSARGHQPMQSNSGAVITYNGEIFNYKELRSRFLSDYNFNSSSDTEVILEMYNKLGTDSLIQFDGMFAFGIWDSQKEYLLLARDATGKKPLYYTTIGGIFAFSSEIKSLLTLPWIKAELDEEALYHFLTFNLLPEPYTMFKGIKKLEPGHYMKVNKSGILEYESFWKINYQNLSHLSDTELQHYTITEIEKSVKDRMVSDVPIGAFLSGGVDSSLLVSIMKRNNIENIKSFSIGFEGQPDFDELKYAQAVSKEFGTDHYERIVRPQDLIDLLPKVVDIFDEPLSDTTSIPIYFISELAKQNNTKVVLTGDGADEIFAGYRSFLNYDKLYPYYNRAKVIPSFIKSILYKSFGLFDKSSPIYEILYRAAKNQEFAWIGANGFKESTKRKVLSQEYLIRNKNLNSYSIVENLKKEFYLSAGNKKFNHIDWMCFMGYKIADVNRFLFRSDRLAMAHSVETRSPFLNKKIVELALSIPASQKIKNGEPKYILKKAAEKHLSNDVLYRKKKGFCVPMKEWAGQILIDEVIDQIDDFCRKTGVFNKNEILIQLKALEKGNTNYTNNIWTIYFLIKWFNRWM